MKKLNFANISFKEFQDEKTYNFTFCDVTNLMSKIDYHLQHQKVVALLGKEGFGKTRFLIEYVKKSYPTKAVVIDFVKLNSSYKIDNFMISCLINEDIERSENNVKDPKNYYKIKDWDFILNYLKSRISENQNFNISQHIAGIFGKFLDDIGFLLIIENGHEKELSYVREFLANLECKTIISFKEEKIREEQLSDLKKIYPYVEIERRDVESNIEEVIDEISYNDETKDFLLKYSHKSFYHFNKYIEALLKDGSLERLNDKYLFKYQKEKGIPTTFYECLNTLFSDLILNRDLKEFLHIIASYNEQYFPKSIVNNDEALNNLCELNIIRPSDKELYVFDHEMVKDYVVKEFFPVDSRRYKETILRLLAKKDNSNFYDKIADVFASIEEWEYAIAFLYEHVKGLRNNIEKISILRRIVDWIHEWQTEDINNGKIKELEILEELARLKIVVYHSDGSKDETSTLYLAAKNCNNHEYMAIARCLGAWHNNFDGKNNLDQAYHYFRKNYNSAKLKYYKARCLFNLCTREKAWTANFKKARFYIKKAKQGFSKKDKELLFYYWQGLGSVYLEQMNFKKAHKCWEEAYNVIKKKKNNFQEKYCDILCDYAYTKALFNDKDSDDYLKKAIAISEKYNFTRNICRAYLNRANHLFYNLNLKNEALQVIELAISKSKESNDEYILAISLFSQQMFNHNTKSRYELNKVCEWAFNLLKKKPGDIRIKSIVKFYFSVEVLSETQLEELNNLHIDIYLSKWREKASFEDIEKDNLYYKNGKYAIFY